MRPRTSDRGGPMLGPRPMRKETEMQSGAAIAARQRRERETREALADGHRLQNGQLHAAGDVAHPDDEKVRTILATADIDVARQQYVIVQRSRSKTAAFRGLVGDVAAVATKHGLRVSRRKDLDAYGRPSPFVRLVDGVMEPLPPEMRRRRHSWEALSTAVSRALDHEIDPTIAGAAEPTLPPVRRRSPRRRGSRPPGGRTVRETAWESQMPATRATRSMPASTSTPRSSKPRFSASSLSRQARGGRARSSTKISNGGAMASSPVSKQPPTVRAIDEATEVRRAINFEIASLERLLKTYPHQAVWIRQRIEEL